MERLQKVIAQAGVTSRRKAEALILAGKVKVDGKIVTELGTKVKGDAKIEVNGQPINKEDKVYFVMNKPRNCLCSVSDDRERPTVVDLISTDKRIFPVGRLDFDTTGILILTNDGNFANEMTHPRYHIPKVYQVTISGIISLPIVKQLEAGIELEDGLTQPAKIRIIKVNEEKKYSVLEIRITEGKNRQVKRMMEHFGFDVKRLNRKRLGNLEVKDLNQGEYRMLKPFEVQALRALVNEHKTLK